MPTQAIIFESVLQDGRPFQQLSNLTLNGLSTKDETLNSDNGKLYGDFAKVGSDYTLNLYKDITKSDLVASAMSTSLGVLDVTEENDSGLSGSVNFAQYSADDNSIEVICFLSKDSDLPMANLEGLSDYDQDRGFAAYHLMAFDYMKQFCVSRYKSLVFRSDMIDTSQINDGVGKGGYDLSRVLNWSSLREASAHYAFSRIAERQGVEDNIFLMRADTSKGILKAHLASVELQFDSNNDRVEDKSRSFSVWRIGRA